MRRLHVVAALALAASCGSTTSNVPRARLSPKDIVKRASPAIVRIEAGRDKVGTGFILDKAGLVATNLHVIAGEAAIKIRLHDGTQYQVTQIVGLDPGRDLALLRIKVPKELPTLKLGDSDEMSAGDQIVAIGNPLGVFDYSVTSGLISQIRPWCGAEEIAAQQCKQELTVLQISAAISPGSSGGPLFNQFGEVVGVTTAIITAGQNINLAVPGNYLKPLVAQRATITPDEFARETKAAGDARSTSEGDDNVRISRRIPRHEIAVYDGCKLEDIAEVVRQIGDTIENGAPLYNDGKHEACFRIYEGTSVKLERDGQCKGVRSAFGDGLLRAGGLKTYKEKAWALRDTFDGLLDAAKRWADAHPPGGTPSGPSGPSGPSEKSVPAKGDGAKPKADGAKGDNAKPDSVKPESSKPERAKPKK
jgi:serine protease Do